MALWVGFDVGKTFHWVCVLDECGKVVLSRRIQANEEVVQRACAEITAFGDSDSKRSASTWWADRRPSSWRLHFSGTASECSTCPASQSTRHLMPTAARPRAPRGTPT